MITSMIDSLGHILLSLFTLYLVVMVVISHLIKLLLDGAIKLIKLFVRKTTILLTTKGGEYIKTKKAY
ncbi:hypothetical protein AAGG74_15900 [Bacillus mexicanus]|uniref:hypothetical protein n=1 Tax=Bacillus mexicanus TaxID=2834415 RepID=UPI003D1D3576